MASTRARGAQYGPRRAGSTSADGQVPQGDEQADRGVVAGPSARAPSAACCGAAGSRRRRRGSRRACCGRRRPAPPRPASPACLGPDGQLGLLAVGEVALVEQADVARGTRAGRASACRAGSRPAPSPRPRWPARGWRRSSGRRPGSGRRRRRPRPARPAAWAARHRRPAGARQPGSGLGVVRGTPPATGPGRGPGTSGTRRWPRARTRCWRPLDQRRRRRAGRPEPGQAGRGRAVVDHDDARHEAPGLEEAATVSRTGSGPCRGAR